ncbi:hypothetical protein ACQR16_01400 [Bradyrhizobium oligotrophicum]
MAWVLRKVLAQRIDRASQRRDFGFFGAATIVLAKQAIEIPGNEGKRQN